MATRTQVTLNPARPPPDESLAQQSLPSWIDTHWRRVRVTNARVESIQRDGAAFQIRAVVHLGALLPADVHVDISLQTASGTVHPDISIARCGSVQSYRNGAFVFDATIAARELRARTGEALVVRVRPDPHRRDRSAAGPVIGLVMPLGHGFRRDLDEFDREESAVQSSAPGRDYEALSVGGAG